MAFSTLAFLTLTLLGQAAEESAATQETAETQPTATRPTAIRLNFRDVPLDAVLDHLSEAAGLSVVRGVTVEGRITLISRQPLSVDQAVELLNTALKEKNYAAVRNGRILKIVPLADAKKASVPVQSGNRPELIEPTDVLVTQVIPIRYVDATKLKQDLGPLVPAYAELAANASSNALILTDTQANVRRIVQIVQALDTCMAGGSEVAVFQLQYADASETARLINDVFKEEDTSQQRTGQSPLMRFLPPFMRGERGGPPGQQQPEGEVRRVQQVKAAADTRTNTVVVSAAPDTLQVIQRVIKELDSNPLETQAVFTYPLQNASAKNLASVLNELFDESHSFYSTGSTSSRSGQAYVPRAGGAQRGQPGPAPAPGAGAAAQGRVVATSWGQSQTTTTASTTDLVGQVYCVADEDTNSLLVLTPSKNFDRVKEIIKDLDRPIPQVLIKVLIAEVTHDKSVDLGAEFSILNVRSSGFGTEAFTDFGVQAQSGGLIFRTFEKDVEAAVRLLEKVGKLDVLSRPYILASDNQEATITVGEEVPFIRSSTTTDAGQTINTIEYEDIGIILKVTPHINPEGLVIMTVAPEISTLTGTTVPISEKLTAPVYAKRSAESRIAIRDSQTIVIGGLIKDEITSNVQKVPLLGDIPLLGLAFQRVIRETQKTELLIFLTPHVALEASELKAMSEHEVQRTRIVPQAVKPGTFQEHLEGMKRGTTQPSPAKP